MAILASGSYFGECELLNQEKREYTAIVYSTEATLLSIDHNVRLPIFSTSFISLEIFGLGQRETYFLKSRKGIQKQKLLEKGLCIKNCWFEGHDLRTAS